MNYDEYVRIIAQQCFKRGITTLIGQPLMAVFYYHGVPTYNVVDKLAKMEHDLRLTGREPGTFPYDSRCEVEVGDRVVKIGNHPLDGVPAGIKGIVVGSVFLEPDFPIAMVWWEDDPKDLTNNISRDKIRVL